MKKFTKQNFKTNPLWIRLLIMAFMLLAGAGNAWSATHTFIEGEYIFIKNFKPSGWGDCWIPSNGYAWAHMWGGTAGEKDYLFELHSGTAGAVGAIYRAKITTAGTYTNIIFTRNSSNKGPWDDKWNQTGTISLNATNNCATSFTSDGTSCSWSCYPTSVTEYNLNGSSGSTVKLSGSQIGLIYDLYKDNTIVSGQTKAGNGNSLTWTVTEGGEYTVKASNACKSATAMTGTYTYTPVTITGYELAGFGNEGWDSPIAMTDSNSDGVYTCTKQLSIDDYIGNPNGFKILERYSDGSTKYYGNNGSMTRGECTGWTMDSNTSTANCGLYTDVVGNYTFSFTASTKKLTVAFPTACTPPTNNKKVVIKSTSRAYVYAWTADANETKLLGEWPGTQMSNTKVGNYYSIEIPTETDVKIILNNGSGKQTSDIGPLTKGKEYTYQFTLGETTYKELRSTCLEPGCDDPAKPTIKINGETGSVSTCGEDGTLTIDANHVAESYKLFTKSSTYTEKGTISDKTIQVTTTGTYVVRAYNGECMTESDPITFTKNTLPTISTSTLESQTICENSSTTLSVKENMTSYLWSTEETTQSISVSKAGTYTVTATDAYGCESNTLTFTIEVNDLPSTPTFDAAPSYCAGEPITLPTKDNAGNSVTWYKQDGTAAGTPANTAGTYTYKAKATNANGCVSADYGTYQYTVKPKVAIAWNQASENMLVNNTQNVSTTLTGTGNVVYTSSDNTIIKVEGNKLTALKTGTATITATATGTNDYCGTATVTKEITITCVTVNAPNITASDICSGGTATLTLKNRQDGVTYKLNSTSGTAIFGSSTTYTTPALDGNTTYKIYASHANACTNNIEGSVTVTVASAPQTPSLSTNINMLNNTNKTATLTIGNYVSGVTYTLYKGENSTEKTTTGTTFTVTEGGIYKVKGTNTNNPSACQDTEFSNEVTINVCPTPATPSLSSTAVTACDGTCTAQGYIIIGNMGDYKDDTYTFELGNSVVTPDANGRLGINSTAYTQYTVTVTNSCGNSNNAQVDIAINDNKPTITGNNSFQPGGSTTLTSDKGESTTWEALDGGDITGSNPGTSIVFTAEVNGTYRVQATYNGCSTTVEIKVQDDLYVWVRRPIKKETAYDQFYHKDQNSEQGGDLFYKEFASLPDDYKQYNQGGKAAEQTCTDKDGYTWYGFVVSKEAIENNYYFTVHAPNDGGEQGDAAKYNGFYTHTYATQLVDMDADLYFVMDETPSNVSRGWNINTPVVVRASGDASFNGNNFADFVPLYVKDANICGKEVVSFEWQKSDSQNGTYTTYNGKSGEGINNIRTRGAGWYRCVVTYGDGKGTATSNAIQVTNAGGTSYTFTSKLPIIMVNTNGVGFPKEPASGFPSVDAENLKAKVSVDVIIKKGEDIVYDRKARMNYRGSSSLNFQKKSYAFVSGQDSCVFDKSRHDYVKTKKEKMLNLLGDANYTTSDKDWVLYAATPDPSMMRNRLVFDLYQQMRQGEWGVHSTYVELIVDGEYQGVYVFMDKITANEGRVNITNSDGFIVKFDKTDVADRVERDGDQKTFATTRTGTKNTSEGITSYDTKIDQRFEIEYPEKEDIEDAGGNWEAFYSKVQQRFEDFETALANKQYDKVRTLIDYDSWADWFILTEFIKNQDGFRASNIFIYNGGKIIATPLWDQELSMDNRTRMAHGSSSEDGLLSTTSSVYSDAFPAPFWFTNKGTDVNNLTGGLLNDPCFVALVKSKWDDYQADVLSASNCSTLVAKYDGELDNNIRTREATKWPYTLEKRGKTTKGSYIGYYSRPDAGVPVEGDPNHYSYNASKNAITSYASKRSTELKDNVGGLGEAIFDLNGETLIFNIKPNIVETYPWQQSIVTVNAPEGYEYVLDYSALPVGAEVKENGNAYTIKMPRPSNWETSGNGTAKKETYTITATIDAEGENSCGAQIENTATATINVNDVTEDCDPPIVKP